VGEVDRALAWAGEGWISLRRKINKQLLFLSS